ncbi:MAG: HIT family protein, partial [Burkholderiaceae bacterium]|nr:HIT family protein [Burkholderiaceae bacterium]
MVNECIFCQIPKNEIVAESDLCLAFYDQFPVSPGHLLIIPKRHVAGYFDLTEDEVKAMQTMLFDMKKVI